MTKCHFKYVAETVSSAILDGPEAGLTHIDAVLEHGDLADYCLARIQPVQICTAGSAGQLRLGPLMRKALALNQQEAERQYLQERTRQL